MLANLSFAELRDRLKARFVDLDSGDELDLAEVLKYLNTLPDNADTLDSVDALIELATNFFFEAKPAEALEVASELQAWPQSAASCYCCAGAGIGGAHAV